MERLDQRQWLLKAKSTVNIKIDKIQISLLK